MRDLLVTPQFERDLRRVPVWLRAELDNAVGQLRINPSNRALGARKLRHVTPTTWRVRCGRYRLLYIYDATSVTLLRVGHRKDIYR